MAMRKFGNAAVVTPVVSPGKWVDKKVPAGRIKTAKDVLAKYDPSQWLLSHVTIIASVDVDLADPKDKKSNYLIKPEYSIFVNNNGDSWERNLLKQGYKTFLGADNYVEHVQIPELSKGKVIDVVLREVPFTKDREGNDLTTLYVDILIATNRKHGDLVRKIEAGEYNATSMGCGLAGTPIVMADGSLKSIELVQEGDVVLTHTGSARPVTKLFQMPVRAMPLYSVDYVGANEPLRLTGEHPILVARKDSVRCTYTKQVCRIDRDQSVCTWSSKVRGDVKIDCGRDKESYEYDLSFVPISEVRKGDYIAKVYPTEVKDNEEFTEDLCTLIGRYTGDGYIGWQWKDKKKDYPAYVGFCFGMSETELIDSTKEILRRVCPEGTTITDKVVPERNGHYINVYDKRLTSFLYENVGEGAWNKRLSQEIMQLPHDKQMRVIEGMFDTDGCFYEKAGSLVYSSVSSDLINQMHLLLLRNGIANAREKVYRKPSGKKKTAGWQETVSVHKGFSNKIASYKNKEYRGDNCTATKHETVVFYKNYVLCPITSVTHLSYAGTVYNFSVEEDESYAVNDAAVHNCLIKYSQCSQCGNIAEDEANACKHIRYFKNNYFYDKEGKKRIIAELCGRAEDPDSCRFIDASWVRKPAFEGAVLRNILAPGDGDVSEKLQKAVLMPSFKAEPGMMLRAASHAAAELVNEIEAQDEKAAPPPPPAPKDDAGFPDAPADAGKPLQLDTPPPEGGEAPPPEGGEAPPPEGGEAPPPEGGLPPDAGGAAPGGAAPGGAAPGAAPAPEPQIQEPPEDASVKEVKDMVRKQVLNEIRRGLLKNEVRTQQEQRPSSMENETNESLIKDASYKKLVAASSKIRDDRLRNGILILSNLKDWKRFKKYGYNRNDVLGILYYADQVLSDKPVGSDTVKALSRIKLASNDLRKLFTEVIVETGRKPETYEARKIASWVKILRYFE